MHSFDPLENSVPLATKPPRKMKAEKPADPAPRLVHFDRSTLTGMLTIKGVAYYFSAIMDDETFLGWRLYREDGPLVKQIDVTVYDGVCECDCESSNYSKAEEFVCKHRKALIGFNLLAAPEVAHV